MFLTFLPLLGLNNLYSDDDGDLLGFLGTQCFQDWLGINHPQGNILRSIDNKTVKGWGISIGLHVFSSKDSFIYRE